MISLIECIALTTAFVILSLYIKERREKSRFFSRFPSPPGNFLLGNALDFGKKDVLEVLRGYIRKFGKTVCIRAGPLNSGLLIADYKFLEFLLSSNKVISKSENYTFLQPWLGTGLLTGDGPKWRKNRKLITPAFHFKILEQFVDVFESTGEIMVKKLREQCGKPSVDIYPYVTLCALDIICETTMGTKVNTQENKESDYVHSVKEMCRILVLRATSPLMANDFFFKLSQDGRIQKRSLRVLHDFTNKVIDSRIEDMKKRKKCETLLPKSTSSSFGGTKRRKMAFLDLLLEEMDSGQNLTIEEIREEVDTFMFEGHDTTATAISFILFCIAHHPEVQAKIIEEQRQLFGDDHKPKVTISSLTHMKYLELVIKEGLRLYPSVPLFSRRTTEDVEYYGGVIPKGVRLVMLAFEILRDPDYFPNPDNFDPSRFENVTGAFPYAYIPFSAGPRNCIGQKFAMLEMKSTISKVVRNFELLPAVPQHFLQLKAETVLKSGNGVKVGLRARF